jgi:hypothetical protein
MAYLTILAIGGFGLLVAGVSHYFVWRERREILAAQAQSDNGRPGHARTGRSATGKALAAPHPVGKRDGSPLTPTRAKQYSKRSGLM